MVTQQAGTVTSSGSGVLLSGTVPPLADAYYPREQSGPNLASTMRPASLCALGQLATNPVTSAMKYFPKEFAKRVQKTGKISRKAD